MKHRIRYFVEKPGAAGEPPRFYWQPSADLRALGWKLERLPDARGEAIAAAEAINRRIDAARGRLPAAAAPPAPLVRVRTAQEVPAEDVELVWPRRLDRELDSLPDRSLGGHHPLGVYVIGSHDGPQKIGISRSPGKRLLDLVGGSGRDLRLHLFVVGSEIRSKKVEQRAHEILAKHRLEGEWFHVSADAAIRAVLDALWAERPAPLRPVGGRPNS